MPSTAKQLSAERDAALSKHRKETHFTLDNHDQLEDRLNNLVKLLESGDTPKGELKAYAQTACAAAKELKVAYVGKLPPHVLNERCPKRALKLAQRVFDIPELLEMIISKLSLQQILVAQRVNKQFHNAIESSVVLQRELALRPESNSGYLRTPFKRNWLEKLPGFFCDIQFHQSQEYPRSFVAGNRVTIKAVLGNQYYFSGDHEGRLPSSIGDRWRQMYICQPPPTEMKVWPSCCDDRRLRVNPALARDTIQNSTGLTLGNLYDKAQEIRAEHRLCPLAYEHDHLDTTGEVNVAVYFAAEVELHDNDPILEQKRQAIRENSDSKERKKAWAARMSAYIAAKQAAAANGLVVPTLAEFEASQDQAST